MKQHILITLSLCLLLAACGSTESEGTGKGDGGGCDGTGKLTCKAAGFDDLLSTLCATVDSCTDLSYTECQANIGDHTINDEFGLPEDSTTTISDIEAAHDSGTLQMNYAVLDTCIASVQATSCDNVPNISSVEELSSLEGVINSECGEDSGEDLFTVAAGQSFPEDTNDPEIESDDPEAIIAIANSLCAVVGQCTPVSIFECMDNIGNATGLGDEFGLGELSEETSFAAISAGVANGSYLVQDDVLESCLEHIDSWSCDAVANINTIDDLWKLENPVGKPCGEDDFSEEHSSSVFIVAPQIQAEDNGEGQEGEGEDEADLNLSDDHTQVADLVEHICDVVIACDPNTAARCEQGVASALLGDEFGVTDSEQYSLRDFHSLVYSGEYSIDLDVLSTCAAAIENTSCKEIAGYNMEQPEDFFAVEEFIGTECGEDGDTPLFVPAP